MNRKAQAAKAETPKQTDMLLRQFIGYNMKRAYLQVQEDMARTLEPLGLRVGTFSALAVIMGSPGISQTQLSEVLNIKRSGVVVVVDDLERAGAVERKPVRTDRRAYALHVTQEGSQLWKRAEAAVQAHEAALFTDLEAPEQRALQELLVRAARSAKHTREAGK
ncbi:MarR family winged helix-turn-helix transcriptional regulator [Poseidonocella sedimentorum]|uniref:DNA-binding transcriptional regulator, MarR family n=1 Tax=Poseidonocella sedimentorum TaxID=871652 RepID=A0A1I6E619_9RHOB|nr:MarR family transcriptional regulator [Poseidonocella sedimentorum]SFR13146.1 DNA-binding transcriptional regulator, MarR family [Poseidonocella sedimentorum]